LIEDHLQVKRTFFFNSFELNGLESHVDDLNQAVHRT
jgi:hypothetical protein